MSDGFFYFSDEVITINLLVQMLQLYIFLQQICRPWIGKVVSL